VGALSQHGLSGPDLDDQIEILATHQRELDTLAKQRLRVGATLTLAMLVIYFTFILSVAFAPDFLGEEIVPGLSVGMVLGVIVILSTWVLILIYVRWANVVYEPAVRRLKAR
jgi:uncharacterized membrane protein (DUF485 family)